MKNNFYRHWDVIITPGPLAQVAINQMFNEE